MKKYLIIRFSSIGDIVLTTPIIRCLKEQTKAEIHFVTKKPFSEILTTNPNVDKVYTIEKEITEISAALKAEQYDFVIDLHNNLRSVRLKKLLKQPSAAFPKLNPQKFILTNFKWNVMPDVHIVDRYFEAVKKLNVTNDLQGLDYFVPKKDEVKLSEYKIPDEFIAFSIGAKFATKRLPNDKIIEIVKQLNHPVVLLGGADDEENASEILQKCSVAISLVGKLNLNQSASVIQQAKKVITHDTGLMHIAAAFQKPIISIWGNTVPALGMYPYLPSNPELSEIHEVDTKCRPCSKIGYQKCPKQHFRCMKNQNTAAIAASANE